MKNGNIKKVLSVLCCVLLLVVLVAGPATIKADAAGVVLGILVPAAIAALTAWGIGTLVDGLSKQEVYDFFDSELDAWSVAANVELASIEAGIGMTTLGQLVFNPFAGAALRTFAQWMVQRYSLVDGGDPVPVVSTAKGLFVAAGTAVTIGSLSTDHSRTIQVTPSNDSYLLRISSENSFRVFTYVPNSLVSYKVKNSKGSTVLTGSVYAGQHSGDLYYTSEMYSNGIYEYQADIPIVESLNAAVHLFNSSDGTLDLVPSDVIGIPLLEDIENKDVVINWEGMGVGMNTQDVIDSVMEQVINNELTTSYDLVDTETVVTDDTLINQGAITQTAEGVTWPDIVQPVAVIGLEDVFPFCIPFDIIDFLRTMNAAREAPCFEWPILIPSLNFEYTIEIDLEGFDTVATILRTMELLLFIVGLAFVTRSMIIRG